MKEEIKNDDHHCSVIERKHVKVELAGCDANSNSEDERHECHATVLEDSMKREQACKYS
ncbi:MAG: hypothetical protein ABIJ59_01680 [Pseudomonadota bacterium]